MTDNKAETLINALMQLHPKGFDLSLERIGKLLEKCGNPHLKLPPIIHIAGTNGKGSASAYCRSLLEAAGYSVHVHTSPHLVRWHERYRLGDKNGGKLVDDATLCQAIEFVAKANNNAPITVFEILTVVAFYLFAKYPADVVILEVGLGGRFDATNIIEKSAVSLIMPISLDHEAFLGDTIAKIAFEKAGIIKKNTPVVVAKQESDDALEVLHNIAARNHAPIDIFGQDYQAYFEHGRMAYQDEDGLLDLPLPNLQGVHQIENAAAAIKAIKTAGFIIDEMTIAKALQNVIWPARMQYIETGTLVEKLTKGTKILLDGGHNPAAAKTIAAYLQKNYPDTKPIMITGMLNTKDASNYYKALIGLVEKIYTVPIQSSDAGIDPKDLCQTIKALGFACEPRQSVADALSSITSDTPKNHILICGSLYLAGDFLQENNSLPV